MGNRHAVLAGRFECIQRRTRYREPNAERFFLLNASKVYFATAEGNADLADLLAELRRSSPTFTDDWANVAASEHIDSPLILRDTAGEYSVNRVRLSIEGSATGQVIVLLPAAVPVTAELLDHSQAEDLSFRGVMEHVKLDQP